MMCKVTPREVLERFVAEFRAGAGADKPPRQGRQERAADPGPKKAKPKPGAAPGGWRIKAPGPVERCRAYLAKLPASVEGDDGSKRIFQAARVIWNDFGIDEAEGLPLLAEYNERADPPWDAGGKQGYRRKWDEAVGKGPGPDGRGYRLNEDRPGRERDRGSRSAAESSDETPNAEACAGEEGAGEARPSGELPQIVHNIDQYRDVDAAALDALVRANTPPKVFVGNGCGLVDLQRAAPDVPLAARELDGPSLRLVFSRAADWIKRIETQHETRFENDFPPPQLLSSFTVRGEWPGVPFLRGVVTYPVYGPGWSLSATPGYHPEPFIYCDLGSLVVPDVAPAPTPADVAAAVDLIVNDMLGDFPFVGEPGEPNASLANAVAMLILPVIRHAIDGPTPLGVIDAPAEGTGKSLLAEAITLATVGEIPEPVSPDVGDEEWNKLLLAMLMEGQPIVYLDNANKRLDSGALASALTARWKRGRVLGETLIARARVNVCWILTANNFECSREIARRVYWSRLDRGVENPGQHTGYRHPDLLGWVRANRPRILAAVLTLVNNWLAKGGPAGAAPLGKFEAWAAAVGGILEAAGIAGFLANGDEFRKQAASQANEMPAFVKAWWARHRGAPVIAAELFADAQEILESVLTAESDDGRRRQLGKFLAKQRDRVFGNYRIKAVTTDDGKDSRDYAGRPRWRLQELKGQARPTAPHGGGEYAEGDEPFGSE